MHQRKSLRSNFGRSAMIPGAFLWLIAAGCADQQPTAPRASQLAPPNLSRALRLDAVSFNDFLLAWSRSYSSSPIQTQMFTFDARQDRQYIDLYPDETVLAFARANPGHLYIAGDEPDQWCIAATEYAAIYHNFVTQVRGADSTARLSPAGFAEPNEKCCPPGDEQCKLRMHSAGYAEQFYNAYIQRYGAAPPVNEWRFHDFGVSIPEGDVGAWWARVDRAAAWSVAHGANMVLGGWGFHAWKGPIPAHQEQLKQAIGLLVNDRRINSAVYWSYEPWIEAPRPLVYTDGSLTPEGQTYANPLTDTPGGVKLVASADGHASLRWNNTTSAWGAEVEFWVQTPGTETFVHHKTELVPELGAAQTSFVALNTGQPVKARVRYYNPYGRAPWSPFSNSVLPALTEAEADQRKVHRNRPLLCFLRLC